jgi:Calx-beta domain
VSNRLIRVLATFAMVAGLVLAGQPARASFHRMVIHEVFAGTTDHLGADFVELVMLADDQDEVDGTRLRFYNSAGQLSGTETLEGDLADGDAGETILIATAGAATLFGVTPDFTLATNFGGKGGKVCFESPPAGDITTVIDCASWGKFEGSSTGSGTPFMYDEDIPPGASMLRKEVPPFLLDTANSHEDFMLNGPTPRTFAGVTGTPPGSVFGLPVPPPSNLEEGGEWQFPVIRTGDTDEPASVSVAIRTRSATGSDVSLDRTVLNFPTGDDFELGTLEITDDDEYERREHFWLMLRDPSDEGESGSVLNERPQRKVEIGDNEVDGNPPASAIYRPKDGGTYRPGELTKFKGTVVEGENESGVRSVRMALKKNLENGHCKWLWPDGHWRRRSCSNERFLGADMKTQIEWRFKLDKRLKPSIGSNIKSYTAISKAHDKAGNAETAIEDPNRCRFEITEPVRPE